MKVVAAKNGTATARAAIPSAARGTARAELMTRAQRPNGKPGRTARRGDRCSSRPGGVRTLRHAFEHPHHLIVQVSVAGEDASRFTVERPAVEMGGPASRPQGTIAAPATKSQACRARSQ